MEVSSISSTTENEAIMKKTDKPVWVTLGWILLGLNSIETKKGAMTLFMFFLASSFACIPVSIYLVDWSWAGMMFPFSLLLWLCFKCG